MGFDSPSRTPAPLHFARLVGVGLIVFLANAALLLLQLTAGPLLAPFVGSSLETWTAVIGVFLSGIALGNALGGKLADRYPTPRTLAALLALGAIAAGWMAVFPMLLAETGAYKSLPLGPRIPVLAIGLCLPAGLILSLLTPLAIKLGLSDVSRTGRVTGVVLSLSTLGCLVGNYAGGFVLIPSFTINTLVYVAGGALAALALGTFLFLGKQPSSPASDGEPSPNGNPGIPEAAVNPYAFSDIRRAFVIVFLASFCGMTLELTASRVLAQHLGVSLFTWTGVIGVMLAGTALGNFLGGVIADRVNRPGPFNPRYVLAGCLLLAGALSVFQLMAQSAIEYYDPFHGLDLITQVVGSTFCLFFMPMLLLGTISPQVIRLAVPDVAHVGRVAGRLYAWSTVGAIAGTFATGYATISLLGMTHTVLLVALVVALTSMLVANIWDYSPLLYIFAIVLGEVSGGFILNFRADARDPHLVARRETNYYTITVKKDRVYDDDLKEIVYNGRWNLTLDHLIHSCLDPNDPSYLHYTHEHIQMEFLRGARSQTPAPRVLVVGGGGYTFPRYALEQVPETQMDVVEIDPGVTRVAKEVLGLKDYPGLSIHHMDGRQYISERVPRGTYDLIVQDAVNDLSVPSHLLTKEYNDAVKATLKPNGVYLLTVIDSIGHGKIWKAAMNTLALTYPAENIALLTPDKFDPSRCLLTHARLLALRESRQSDRVPDSVIEKLLELEDKDLSLPEFLAEIKRLLTPDELERYDDVILTMATSLFTREVFVIYASDRPLDLEILRQAAPKQTASRGMMAAIGGVLAGKPTSPEPILTHRVSPGDLKRYLDAPPRIILTDQYAPVDNLMADEFRYRYRKRPKE
jgi:predicted membrane-bound spermidine synthase